MSLGIQPSPGLLARFRYRTFEGPLCLRRIKQIPAMVPPVDDVVKAASHGAGYGGDGSLLSILGLRAIH